MVADPRTRRPRPRWRALVALPLLLVVPATVDQVLAPDGSEPGGQPASDQPGDPAPAVSDPVVPPSVAPPSVAPVPSGGSVVRPMVFPVLGPTLYADDWGDCRGGAGCPRRHQGTDLLGVKLQPLLAATDGVVRRVLVDRGISGNGIEITDAEGGTYVYYHLNNDWPLGWPGDLGPPFKWAVPAGLTEGTPVRAGQVIGFLGDSGNAEGTPHLHFELHRPDGTPVNPFPSLRAAEDTWRCAALPVAADPLPLDLPALGGDVLQVRTASGFGTWLIDAQGRVMSTGDAAFIGHQRRLAEPCPTPG